MDGKCRWLFVYGTLRDPEVQRAVFGRSFAAQADRLGGYRLVGVVIDGVGYSGLQRSDDPGDEVEGLVLPLTAEDLALADAYEGETHYVRAAVRLRSGRDAFVYVAADG